MEQRNLTAERKIHQIHIRLMVIAQIGIGLNATTTRTVKIIRNMERMHGKINQEKITY